MDWSLQLCLRIVLTATPEELLACYIRGNHGQIQGSYGLVCSLEAHGDIYSSSTEKALLQEKADVLTESFGGTILNYLRSLSATESGSSHGGDTTRLSLEGRKTEDLSSCWLKEFFLHHLLQIRCNTHAISVLTTISNTAFLPPASASHEAATAKPAGSEEREERVVGTSQAQLGNALYLSASLVNHSCHPNVYFRFVGYRVVVIATRRIAPGEEVNNCYGPMVGRMKRVERRKELQRKYFFDCHCPACENPSPELQYREVVGTAFSCPECRGPLMEGDALLECLACGNSLAHSELENHIRILDTARKKMALGNNTGELPLMLECQALQSRVLHVHNLELGRTNDAIAQAYAIQGDFHTAAHYCKLSCEAVGAAFGEDSIELGHELHKLAQLYFNSRQYKSALDCAKKAVVILKVYNGTDCPDCVELNEMIKLFPSD